MREVGFRSLGIIPSATLNGAEVLGWADKIGAAYVVKLADFLIVEENPIQHLLVLYDIGAVKYIIKGDIIYDAKQLLADVKKMFDTEK